MSVCLGDGSAIGSELGAGINDNLCAPERTRSGNIVAARGVRSSYYNSASYTRRPWPGTMLRLRPPRMCILPRIIPVKRLCVCMASYVGSIIISPFRVPAKIYSRLLLPRTRHPRKNDEARTAYTAHTACFPAQPSTCFLSYADPRPRATLIPIQARAVARRGALYIRVQIYLEEGPLR